MSHRQDRRRRLVARRRRLGVLVTALILALVSLAGGVIAARGQTHGGAPTQTAGGVVNRSRSNTGATTTTGRD
jgi:hypothetical protein